LKKALKKAAVLHQGQKRKSIDDVPYITHPYAVAIILSHYTDDEDLIIAGLLHDSIEDTVYTPEDLEKDFGSRVREIVMGVTEPKEENGEKLPWKVRKRAYLEKLKTDSEESLLLCAADKIYNMQNTLDDYEKHGPKMLKRFNASPEDKQWYHEEVYKTLKQRINSPILAEFESLLAKTRKEFLDR
jgi:(p)ppGpp synthase/HD superfamily hydrolase